MVFWVVFGGMLFAGCSADGEALFQSKGCSNCHSFQGQGGRMGPDLTAVSRRMNSNEIREYLKNPRNKYPQTRMPSFEKLSGAELRGLADYLSN